MSKSTISTFQVFALFPDERRMAHARTNAIIMLNKDRKHLNALEYGAFRVCYRSKSGLSSGSIGNGRDWNEEDATDRGESYKEAHPTDTVWIEHEDPNTGEWRKY